MVPFTLGMGADVKQCREICGATGNGGDMKTFKTGQRYGTASACDRNCIFKFTINRRTTKSVWITGESVHNKRRKIDVWNGEETIMPLGSYSMAPILGANDAI